MRRGIDVFYPMHVLGHVHALLQSTESSLEDSSVRAPLR